MSVSSTTTSTPSTSTPTALDNDPVPYLALDKFHRTISFQTNDGTTHETTYALAGAENTDAPLVVWLNGMGAHRLITATFDGFVNARGYRLLSIDKAGVRNPQGVVNGADVSLVDRVSFAHNALVAVLDKLQISRFSIWSHSNGFIATTYALRKLPDRFTVERYIATAPYVPCTISGNTGLTVASWLPNSALGNVTNVFEVVAPVAEFVGSSISWSGGAFSKVSSWSAGLFPGKTASATKVADPDMLKTWSRTYTSAACGRATFKDVPSEGARCIGQEAILCLKGLPKGAWGYKPAQGQSDSEILRSILVEVAQKHAERLPIQVIYGAKDGMIDCKGREWLKSVMLETHLLSETDLPNHWLEVKDTGHDDVLSFNRVVDIIFPPQT